MNKYGNIRCDYNGHKFDSKAERFFYLYLLKTNDPESILVHPKFLLQHDFEKDNKKYKSIVYEGDFQIGMVVYDVKGTLNMITPVAKIKHKMFIKLYPQCTLKLALPVNNGWDIRLA